MTEITQSVLPNDASGKVSKSFELVLKNYEKQKPEEITDALTLLLKKAYRLLVSEIYDKTIVTPNWIDTERTVTYPVHVTFVDGMPHQISPAGYEVPEREGSVQERFFDVLEELSLLPILKEFSKDLVIIKNGRDTRIIGPVEFTSKEHITIDDVYDLVKTVDFPVKGLICKGRTKRKYPFEITASFRFSPLVIDTIENKFYYEIMVSLVTSGLPLVEWEQKGRQQLLQNLETLVKWNESFEDHLPKLRETAGIWCLDRTTVTDFLTEVGMPIDGRVGSLPSRKDILKEERERLGTDRLAVKEKRSVLAKMHEYVDEGFFVRDYETHCLSCPVSEVKYLTSILAKPLATALLGYGYAQGSPEIVISKADLLRELGYAPEDKQAYSVIRRTLLALSRLEVHSWSFNYTATKKSRVEDPGEVPLAVGHFIDDYDASDYKVYTIRLNPRWYGCVRFLSDDNKDLRTKEERQETFGQRGILSYPGEVAKSKGKSHTLAHYLVTNRGNAKLSSGEFKVFALKMETWAEAVNVRHSRASRRFKDTLKVIEDWSGTLIEKTEPSLIEMSKMPPSKGLKTVLRLWVANKVQTMNEKIADKLEADSKKKAGK